MRRYAVPTGVLRSGGAAGTRYVALNPSTLRVAVRNPPGRGTRPLRLSHAYPHRVRAYSCPRRSQPRERDRHPKRRPSTIRLSFPPAELAGDPRVVQAYLGRGGEADA